MNNKPQIPLAELLRSLWNSIEVAHKRQLFILVPMTVLTSLFEMLSIGLVLPFLSLLTTSNEASAAFLYGGQWLKLYEVFHIKNGLIYLTILLIVVITLTAIFRIYLLRLSNKLAFEAGANLSQRMYGVILHQPYLMHIKRNSSLIQDVVVQKSALVIYGILMPIISIICSCILLFAVLATLLSINIFLVLTLLLSFGLLYGIIFLFVNSRVNAGSIVISQKSAKMIKLVQESIGAIREILIDRTQLLYSKLFNDIDDEYRKAQCQVAYFSASPRYLMESATMLSVVAISSFMYIKNNNAVISALPLMGVVILGAQKLLPMMQQIYSGFISLKSARSSLQEMMEIIAYEIEVYKTIKPSFRSINFNHELSLNFGSFTYENNKVKTINGVNLKIRSGQKVGIIGKSGSGKSTLLDVLMGLIPLQVGTLEIDGIVIDKDNVHLWQKIIAHVPQTIFLVDASVEQNIAFGVDVNKIDAKRMQDAIEKAQLTAVISKLCMGIKTEIGERGVALSGGERQRIGIARAIYKGAKILFLDEATNALDGETEVNVIQALEGIVGLTLIMVAHRKSTLAKCDVLYLVDNGHLSVLK